MYVRIFYLLHLVSIPKAPVGFRFFTFWVDKQDNTASFGRCLWVLCLEGIRGLGGGVPGVASSDYGAVSFFSLLFFLRFFFLPHFGSFAERITAGLPFRHP